MATPAHHKVLQDVLSVGRCKFLFTDLAMKRWVTRTGWSWHADHLVLRTAFRAREILVGSPLIHDIRAGLKGFPEKVYHGRPFRMKAKQYQRVGSTLVHSEPTPGGPDESRLGLG